MSSYARCVGSGLIVLALMGAASAQDHHRQHVADADREYNAVLSRAENPCGKESTTVGYEQCMGKELEFTRNHLDAFLEAVRGILADEDAARPTDSTHKVKDLDLLNQADMAWREYTKNLCGLAFAGFDGGTGAASAEAECEYRADRIYVKQVADAILLTILAK
jgi:uncharacterized protein YecT (DUF1311 family)